MLLLADDPDIWTAPLPVLVAIAGLGFQGYSLLVVGLLGTVLWCVDNL